jgi:hypothetical protein
MKASPHRSQVATLIFGLVFVAWTLSLMFRVAHTLGDRHRPAHHNIPASPWPQPLPGLGGASTLAPSCLLVEVLTSACFTRQISNRICYCGRSRLPDPLSWLVGSTGAPGTGGGHKSGHCQRY